MIKGSVHFGWSAPVVCSSLTSAVHVVQKLETIFNERAEFECACFTHRALCCSDAHVALTLQAGTIIRTVAVVPAVL